MSVDRGVVQQGVAPPLPRSIWVVAWASVAGQVVTFARQGVRQDDEVSLIGSVVLGALLLGYVSAGVVRARTIRLALAWIVLSLGLVFGLVGLFFVDNPGDAAWDVLALAVTAVTLAALARFTTTDWYAWQRTRPPTEDGPRIGRLVAIAVLVGVLGGIAGPADQDIGGNAGTSDR